MTEINENIQKFILGLLRASLSEFTDSLSTTDLQDEKTVKLIELILIRHKLVVTVYPYIKQQSVNDQNKLWKTLENDLKMHNYKYVRQAYSQDHEIGMLLDAFEENHITAIPLKGWELRKLYPEIINRSMVDFDVLVKDYSHKMVSAVMSELGYDIGNESSWKHDNFSKGKDVNVEVHKRLTDDSAYIAKWEQTLWNRTLPYEDKQYIKSMRPEDFYIYHFLHMHKHFCNGALGLRTLVDTWLFLKAHSELNREYLDKHLERMSMLTFSQRIEHLVDSCFETGKLDEHDKLLLDYAITSGVHGNNERYKLGRAVMKSNGSLRSGALKSKFDAVFLPYSRMKAHFPILNKYPFLLPFCWVKRIWRFRHNLSENAKRVSYKGISKADYEKMDKVFKAAGVK